MPIKVLMPALSPTMTEGTLAKWLVKEGDQVAAGDVIAEIETDKATMEVEAVDEGVVDKLLVPEGTEGVAVNTPIAMLRGEDEAAGAAPPKAPAQTMPSAPKTEPAPAAKANGGGAAAQARETEAVRAARNEEADGGRIFASPLARRMAQQAGIELGALTGSGPHGRIVKADIEAALAKGPAAKPAAQPAGAKAPAAPQVPQAQIARSDFEPEFELEKLSSMRKTIARRLTESKQQVPHFYMTIDCEIDALLKLRKELNAKLGDAKLSVNDLVIKAAALALIKVPTANVSYTEEGLRRYRTADISVAVATDKGLITPVVRRAEAKGLQAISAEMRELAAKARDGKLQPQEYQGGSFSISNLGMYGIKHFEAVINPPQACILAVGAGEQRPVVKDGAVAIATVMSCTLSTDHRAVDGAVGAEWLGAFKKLIEDPLQMLL